MEFDNQNLTIACEADLNSNDVNADELYSADTEAFEKIERTLDGSKKLVLKIMFGLGLVLTLPWWPVFGKGFWPELSFLIFYPVCVYYLSKFYIKNVKKAFKLVKRLHPTVGIEQDKVVITFELQYNSIFPFAMAYYKDNFKATRSFGSVLTILKRNDFDENRIYHGRYVIPLNRGYGTYPVGPLEVTVCDPFMIFKETVTFEPDSTISVWLNPPPEEDIKLINTMILSPNGTSSSGEAGHGMDFYGLKEYAPGDDIKAISWSKSAAIGKTVIKQFEEDATPNVFIVLHTDRTQLRGLGTGNAMKRIFRIAAATIHAAKERGLKVKLAMAQDRTSTVTDIGSDIPVYGFMTQLLGNMHAAEPEAMEDLLNTLCYQAGSGSTIMFLSHTLALNYNMLSDAMAILHAKGCRLVVWVIDDSKMLNFSSWGADKVTPDEFAAHALELGILFRMIDPKEQRLKEEAFVSAGKMLGI